MKSYNLSGLNVLVIEQHSLIRDAIRGALEAMHVKKVRLASNVRKAFMMMQGDKPDLILTDWSPGLDGIELMDLIRKDRHSPRCFCSGCHHVRLFRSASRQPGHQCRHQRFPEEANIRQQHLQPHQVDHREPAALRAFRSLLRPLPTPFQRVLRRLRPAPASHLRRPGTAPAATAVPRCRTTIWIQCQSGLIHRRFQFPASSANRAAASTSRDRISVRAAASASSPHCRFCQCSSIREQSKACRQDSRR